MIIVEYTPSDFIQWLTMASDLFTNYEVQLLKRDLKLMESNPKYKTFFAKKK